MTVIAALAAALQFNVLGTPARLAEARMLWFVAAAAMAGALFFYASLRRRRALDALVPARLQATTAPGAGSGRGALAASMSTFAVALCALALAQPQCGTRTELTRRFGVDVVVALDASNSMLARDVRPDRLTRAKLELGQLIDQMKGDRIGIVVFAGDAYVQCPLTTDYGAAKMFLRAVDPTSVSRQGTRIDLALETSRQVFAASDRAAKSKALILLTDGEDHSGGVLAMADKLAEDGVRVFAVPIGSPEGEPIPILDANGNIVGYKKDQSGQTVVTRVDESTLRKIAERTDGRLVASIEEVGGEVARMEKAEFESRLTVQYEDRFQWFLAPALALLMAASLLGRGAWRAALLLLVLAGSRVEAAPLSMKVEEPNVARGNARWKQGFLTDALSDFDAALKARPEAAEALFDRGDALMRLGKTDEAAAAFREAARRAKGGGLESDALYNLGNLEREAKANDRAVRAYRDALVANPEHEDARHNLELLLAQRLEEKKRQQGGEDDQDGEAQKEPKDGQGEDQADQKKAGQDPAPDDKEAEERARLEAQQLSEQDADKLLDALEKSEKAMQMWRFNKDEKRVQDEVQDW